MKHCITFRTAKLAKEKQYINGKKFPKPFTKLGYIANSAIYDDYGRFIKSRWYNPNKKRYLAPSQSQLQKWLRDVYNIHIFAVPNSHGWIYEIVNINFSENMMIPMRKVRASKIQYNTYEEALEEALYESLKDWI